jgi:hypothetical protein
MMALLLLLLLLLQGWLKQMGTFLRQKAPHQLLLSGLEGFFGPASPHLRQHNPHTQASTCSHYRLSTAACLAL